MAPREIAARSFAFASEVLRFCDPLLRRGGVGGVLGRQLAAAATSVGAHLEEAKGAQSRPDFVSKACGALKEGREALYWLRLVEATLDHPPENLEALSREANELVAILTTIVKNARGGASHR